MTERHGLGGAIPVLALLLGGCSPATDARETPDPEDGVPAFEVDASWPRLPADWVMASGLGLFVDARDHVWISHRAELVAAEDLAAVPEPPGVPAPLVMELDQAGDVVQVWGRHDEAEAWPAVLHGFFVDHEGYVWTNARDRHQVLKLTREGEIVLRIGRAGETGGSNDRERLGRPADVYVDPESNELFVVDGYTNRRVIVFDAETGEYRRHWGAYGEAPEDGPAGGPGRGAGTAQPADGPSRQFSTVHGIAGSRDGLVYVADRTNSRIQVFERSGRYVAERVLRPGTGAAFAVALSPDEEQRFLYVADGTEHKVRILRRSDLAVVGELGSEGEGPGQFQRPHNLGVDSRGNLYVAEADPGWRVQRFNLRGLVAP